MSPFDPEVLRRVRRGPLLALAVLTAVRAGAVVVQAFALARLVVLGFGRVDGAELLAPGLVLLAAVAFRALAGALTELVARRASVAVRLAVREDVLEAAVRRGPAWLASPQGHGLPTLAGPGVDALDGYVGGFLPQLLQCLLVPPAVLLGIGLVDRWSLVVLAICLPLLPVFLALVGMHTRRQTEAEYAGLARLSEHFLDVVVGLATLRVFGRARRQVTVLADLAEQHRHRALAVLRTAFLSALVLELVATLSVAVVAVSLGFRLLDGEVGFEAALTVLLLAPEAFLPVRAAGSAFHTASGGRTASAAVSEVLGPVAPRGAPRSAVPADTGIRLDGVTVRHPGRRDAALHDLTLAVEPGSAVAVLGESGAGKSTLVSLLLGMVEPSAGRVLLGGADLSDVDLDRWRQQVSWVPQRPHLFAASIHDNIAMARPTATLREIREAVRSARVDEFVDELPDGLATVLGERGTGLSVGQARRVALARAFLRDAPLVLLDEPTADLDVRSEVAVVASLRALCAGRTAVVTTHRAAPFLDWVDRSFVLLQPRLVQA